jgi:hypothetical protein
VAETGGEVTDAPPPADPAENPLGVGKIASKVPSVQPVRLRAGAMDAATSDARRAAVSMISVCRRRPTPPRDVPVRPS